MKLFVVTMLFIKAYFSMAQSPITDLNWILNSNFSDEFNLTLKPNWSILQNISNWSNETFRVSNITFGNDNTRQFLRLFANAENGTNYSGGIENGYEIGNLGLGYGYYEIEARVLESPLIQSGLWPAFWTIHSWKPSHNPPPYWYEEIDIFEPHNCQVKNKHHEVGYWHRTNESNPNNPINKISGHKYNVDMSLWHKYAVEWLPGRLIFYVDDEPFFWLLDGAKVPSHQNTNLLIDLQVDYNSPSMCPPNISNGYLGSFDINYFRYYQLSCNSEVITENQGNGFNFNNYLHNIKQSCIFKNTSTSGSNITIRFTDFVELKENFEVPLGSVFSIFPSECQ